MLLKKLSNNHLKGSIFYLLAALFLLYEMSVQSSPSVMSQVMMHQLALNPAIWGTVMGAYFWSYTLMQIPVGLLYDRLPSKKLLMLATALCSIGSFVFSISHTPLELALARFLTGFGSAFAFVGVLVIANEWFDKKHFAMLVGIAQLLAAIGAMAGQMPLAYWVNHYGWQKTALILATVGGGLLVTITLIMEQKPNKPKSLAHPQKTMPRTNIIASLKNIFRNAQTFWVGLYAFSAWAPIAFFAELWGPSFLEYRYHISNIKAALATSMIWIALAATSPLLGWYSEYIQKRCLLLKTCSFIGLIVSILILFTSFTTYNMTFFLLMGIGFAAAGQILSFALVKDNNQDRDLATAIGFNNMAVVLGGLIFQPLVGLLVRWHGIQHAISGHIVYNLSDYRFALSFIPVCYIIGLISSSFFIKDSFCQKQTPNNH
jgi:MFS family permease